MRAVAAEIVGPGATHRRRGRGARRRPGPHASRARRRSATGCRQLADKAIADLHGTHFDIPEQVRRIECCLAPTSDGGIYYTGPSEDFSRPGRMWWAVPQGITEFSTWREVTTVYHEGVPGHHLQVGADRGPRRAAQPLAAAALLGAPGTARAGRSTPSG